MLGAWIDPLHYIATELSRMEDAPNDIISKAKDIEGKIRGLLEALKRILSKVCSSLLIFLSFISFIREGAIVVRNECRAALYYIAELNHPASLPKLNWQCYPSPGYFTKYFTHKDAQYKTSALCSPLRNYLSLARGKTPDITRCPHHKCFLTIFTWKHQMQYSPSLRFPFHVFCGQ